MAKCYIVGNHMSRHIYCIIAFMCVFLCLCSTVTFSWCHGPICACGISRSHSLVGGWVEAQHSIYMYVEKCFVIGQ